VSNVTFGGVDLSAYIVTPELSGPHDLPASEVLQTYIPGRDYPDLTFQRLAMRRLRFRCIVDATSHANLLTALHSFRVATDPSLGFCALTLTDVANKRIMARSLGFSLDFSALPYLHTIAQFDWLLEAYPYWEDSAEQTDTVSDLTDSVTNNGDLPCYPVYTCTATAGLVGGLNFSVEGKTFTYEGTVANGKVLIVCSDPAAPDVIYDGTRDFANTADDAEFPELVTGTNDVTISSTDFDLKIDRRERYL